MRKFLTVVIILLIALCSYYAYNLYNIVENVKANSKNKDATFYDNLHSKEDTSQEEDLYKIYIDNKFEVSYDSYAQALAYCEGQENAAIYEFYSSTWVWDNYPKYIVTDNGIDTSYMEFSEAVKAARLSNNAHITFRKTNQVIWDNRANVKSAKLIEIPLILQLPELARGCEVTSAAMLLNYKGIAVDKMTLAEEITKTDTKNPYEGFVGDIYSFSNYGLGVYHGPIFELINTYLPETAMDLTGSEFSDFYYLISKEQPVWVIINNTYTTLKDSSFETWNTVDGPIKITYKEHSVLVTGYDSHYIYFNDPAGNQSVAEKTGFIAAWVQMGRQAISTSP